MGAIRKKMTRTIIRLAIIPVVLVGVFVFGPRHALKTTSHIPMAYSDVQSIIDSLATTPKPIEGTEARVLWHGEHNQRTERVILYLHGFSATRQELAPVPEHLAVMLGANLIEARLSGHGMGSEAFSMATGEAWLADAHLMLDLATSIGAEVWILGVSTGATIASILARDRPDDIAGMLFVSPNFSPKDANATLLLWPWAKQVLPYFLPEERSWEPLNERQEKYWTTRYRFSVLFEMMGVVGEASTINYEDVSTPTLIVYSTDDLVVDPTVTESVYARLGTDRKALARASGSQDPSNHVLAGDIVSPNTTDSMADLMQRFVLGESMEFIEQRERFSWGDVINVDLSQPLP